MHSVSTLNQTDKARKKLAAIARSSRLPYEVMECLFGFHWNLDGREGEWVYERDLLQDEEFARRYTHLLQALHLPVRSLNKQQVIQALLQKRSTMNEAELLADFSLGAAAKDYCRVSRFASYGYLRNATVEKLETLDWEGEDIGAKQIADNLFLKVFRGGAVERYHLEYLYADLVCDLPFQSTAGGSTQWLADFLDELAKAAVKPSLSALRDMLKRHLKGDAHFLKTVLEALSYAGHVKVDGYPVEGLFIPHHRNTLAAHSNRNEWTYPLRFW